MFQAAAKRMNTLIKRSHSTLPEAATRKDSINASSLLSAFVRQEKHSPSIPNPTPSLVV
jgi:hypothetical protein